MEHREEPELVDCSADREPSAADPVEAIYREIAELRRRGGWAALATIVETTGSSPARETMKMLVRADGSTVGSIGGGWFEAEVKRRALELLEVERTALFEIRFDRAQAETSGMLCGGSVRVFVEPVTAPNLMLFGGGHVAQAVGRLAAQVGFRVTVGEDRADLVDRRHFPAAAVLRTEPVGALATTLEIGADTFVLALTRSHADDEEVLLRLFQRGVVPRYLGMLGSANKRESSFARLSQQGASEQWLARVRCPVGIEIGARTANEIAVSIVADLVAVRRGA